MKKQLQNPVMMLTITLGVIVGVIASFSLLEPEGKAGSLQNEHAQTTDDIGIIKTDAANQGSLKEGNAVVSDNSGSTQDLYEQSIPKPGDTIIDDPNYVSPKTIAGYAKEFDVSVTEAEARLRRQGSLGIELQNIVELEGDNVAGWGIDNGSDYMGWVKLVENSTPAEETEHIVNLNADIEIRANGSHSYAQLTKAQPSLRSIIKDNTQSSNLPPEVHEKIAYTGLSMEENTLIVAIDQEWHAEQWASQAEMLESVQLFYSQNIDVPVKVVLDAAPTNTERIYGGMSMPSCTAGFTVVNKYGNRGILTAAHCPDYQSGSLYYRANERFYGSTDVQLHYARPGNEVGPVYRTDDYYYHMAYRTMARSQMMGHWVCHWGMVTGNSCGTVTDINFDTGYIYDGDGRGGDMQRGEVVPGGNSFIKVSSNSINSCGGDSGGPFFDGNTAYGILSGAGYQWSYQANNCRGDRSGSDNGVRYVFFGGIDTAIYYMGGSRWDYLWLMTNW